MGVTGNRLYDKDMGMFLVEMYGKTNDGMKKHELPMITGQVIHSEIYAEDVATRLHV